MPRIHFENGYHNVEPGDRLICVVPDLGLPEGSEVIYDYNQSDGQIVVVWLTTTPTTYPIQERLDITRYTYPSTYFIPMWSPDHRAFYIDPGKTLHISPGQSQTTPEVTPEEPILTTEQRRLLNALEGDDEQ